MAFIPTRHLLLCLCLLALLGHAASQSSDGNGPVVTSVSGCVDVGVMTANCTLPVFLTVRGSGFLTGASNASRVFSSSPAFWISPQLALSPTAAARSALYFNSARASGLFPANDTYFVFQLVYLGQGVMEVGVPIDLTVVLGIGYRGYTTSSAPFSAVSINSAPPPIVNSISGCPIVGADGQSVAQCLPDLNVLTLTGSGFLQWQETPLNINIGSVRRWIVLSLGNSSNSYSYILNDTTLTLSLDYWYQYFLTANDFGASPRAFSIVELYSSWQSTQLSIQFAALPLPSYTMISPYQYSSVLPGCMWGLNGTTIVNCTAGYSSIRITGNYLYEVTATIGGQPLTVLLRLQSNAVTLYLSVPLYNFQPGRLYDLVLTSPTGSITVPNYISFAGTPTIVSAACRDPLLPIDIAVLGCEPGDTVTLNGPYLPPPTIAFTVTVYSLASQQNVTCSNPRYNSEYQLACDMLVAGLPAPGGWDIWSAVEQHIQRPCMLYLTHLIHCCCFRVPCPQVRAVGDWPQHHHSRPLRRMEQS